MTATKATSRSFGSTGTDGERERVHSARQTETEQIDAGDGQLGPGPDGELFEGPMAMSDDEEKSLPSPAKPKSTKRTADSSSAKRESKAKQAKEEEALEERAIQGRCQPQMGEGGLQ